MMLFLLTGCISAKDALGNIGNSNVIMVLSMFVVSAGFNKTQFVKMIGQSVNVLSKGSITKVMFGFIFASVLAATLTGSAAAAFCIMAPIVAASCEELHISPSRVTFCVRTYLHCSLRYYSGWRFPGHVCRIERLYYGK